MVEASSVLFAAKKTAGATQALHNRTIQQRMTHQETMAVQPGAEERSGWF